VYPLAANALCRGVTATFCPRPYAETRDSAAVVDDLITYLRMLRAGLLSLPGTPREAQPQPAVA
jgi:hypothetical protein